MPCRWAPTTGASRTCSTRSGRSTCGRAFPRRCSRASPATGKRVATAIYAGDETAAPTNPPHVAILRRRPELRPQFREHAGDLGRQGRARRHSRRRLHHRSARAGHGEPGLRPAGAEIRHRLRAGERAAAERRRAGARPVRLSADAAGRGGRRRRRRGRGAGRAGLRHLGGAAAICLGADAAQADRQLRAPSPAWCAPMPRPQPDPHPGQRQRAAHRDRPGAQLRRRLDARPVGRHLPDRRTAIPSRSSPSSRRSWTPARAA